MKAVVKASISPAGFFRATVLWKSNTKLKRKRSSGQPEVGPCDRAVGRRLDRQREDADRHGGRGAHRVGDELARDPDLVHVLERRPEVRREDARLPEPDSDRQTVVQELAGGALGESDEVLGVQDEDVDVVELALGVLERVLLAVRDVLVRRSSCAGCRRGGARESSRRATSPWPNSAVKKPTRLTPRFALSHAESPSVARSRCCASRSMIASSSSSPTATNGACGCERARARCEPRMKRLARHHHAVVESALLQPRPQIVRTQLRPVPARCRRWPPSRRG